MKKKISSVFDEIDRARSDSVTNGRGTNVGDIIGSPLGRRLGYHTCFDNIFFGALFQILTYIYINKHNGH